MSKGTENILLPWTLRAGLLNSISINSQMIKFRMDFLNNHDLPPPLKGEMHRANQNPQEKI